MPNAVFWRPGFREFEQVQSLELFSRKPWKGFAPGAPIRLQFFPMSLVGVELVHQALCRSLVPWQIVIRIHRCLCFQGPCGASFVVIHDDQPGDEFEIVAVGLWDFTGSRKDGAAAGKQRAGCTFLERVFN